MQTPQLPNSNPQQFPFDNAPNANSTSVIPLSTEAAGPNAYYPYGKQKEEENAIDLRELWRRIKRRKWLIVLIVSVSTLLMAVETARQKNIYQATATVEIGQNTQMVLKTGDLTIENDNSRIESAMFLLGSYPLLEEAAVRLNLDKNPAFLDITQQRSFWDVVKSKLDKGGKGELRKAETEPLELEQFGDGNFPKLTPEESKRMAPYVGILHDGVTIKQLRTSNLIKL